MYLHHIKFNISDKTKVLNYLTLEQFYLGHVSIFFLHIFSI